MLTPAEIKQKAQRKYNQFLRHQITGEPFFPLDIPFGRPSTTAVYSTLRQEVLTLRDGAKEVRGFGYSIDWGIIQTRLYGEQTLPQRVYFADETDFLRLLGKQKEVAAFNTAVSHTLAPFPQLRDWLIQYPQRVVKALPVWDDLLTVCHYFVTHAPPHGYIRELPIPVHTKFIEENEGVLRQLLDELLPDTAVDKTATSFAARYYLRQPEPLIRLRLLDAETLRPRLGWPATELALPLSALAQLDLGDYPLFIIENLMTFLTFPTVPHGIAIWGRGFGAVRLGELPWLAGHGAVFYWGDVDVQGLEILAGLRGRVPQVQGLLMNTAVFNDHRPFAVRGTPSTHSQPPQLTPAEAELYAYLHQHNLRLEQERIPQAYIRQHISSYF